MVVLRTRARGWHSQLLTQLGALKMANRRKKDEKKIGLKEKIRGIAWGRYLTIVFISAWMFILGVFVGRGTAPVKFDIKKLSRELKSCGQPT